MTTSFSNLPSGAQTPDISTLHFEISGLLLGLWASKERKSGLPAAHLLSQDGAAEDGLRAHTDYAACARTGAHTHTHTSAHRPAQPWGSAIHMDNTSCRLTKRFLTCCVPFLPLDHFGHQHTGQYNHSPECCLTIKQLRLCGRGREPHTISLRLRGKQGK